MEFREDGLAVARGGLWVPVQAGPILSAMPNYGPGRMLGMCMTLAHFDERRGHLCLPGRDLAMGASAEGAAMIIESWVYAAERNGVIPALRSHRDLARAHINRYR